MGLKIFKVTGVKAPTPTGSWYIGSFLAFVIFKSERNIKVMMLSETILNDFRR